MTNLNITLNRKDKKTLQKQLIEELKAYIARGMAHHDLRLPSSRALAKDLNISRITTLTAYEQLIAEGYLYSKTGSGTYINKDIIPSVHIQKYDPKSYQGPSWFPSHNAIALKEVNSSDINFTLGKPAIEKFNIAAWKRSWRHALSRPFQNELPPAEGIPELRQALAEFVSLSRGIKSYAHEIIITSGSVDSINLLANITARYHPISCLENPGFSVAWDIFRRYGHHIQAVEIDHDGLIPSALPFTKDRAKILFCTPSHQFPLGFRLSLPRRIAVLEWAVKHDAIILEDDYDSEFRYDAAPLPTLKAQDKTGHVIYFSSLSKSLSPAIRLGYMIAPENIRKSIAHEINHKHMQPSWLLQLAMAHFIRTGELNKYVRRMRQHYASLNMSIKKGLSNLSPNIVPFGLEAGSHCFLSIPKYINIEDLKQQLSRKGLYIDTMERCYHAPTSWHGFALGYGHLTKEKIEMGLALLVAELNHRIKKEA